MKHGIPLHSWTIEPRYAHDIITDITGWLSLNTADHFSICIDVSLQCIPGVDITNTSKLHGLAWDKFSQDGKN